MIVTDYDYEPHQRSPFDLGLDRVVALDAEGEFMGKAQPPRRSPPIHRTASRRSGSRGTSCPSTAPTVTRDGEEIGVLTSPAASPILGPIGLAILRTDIGRRRHTRRSGEPEGGAIVGTVDVLALYDPAKRRPRA